MKELELVGGPLDGVTIVMFLNLNITYLGLHPDGVYLAHKNKVTSEVCATGYYLMTTEKRYGEGLENDEYLYGSWMGKILNTN